MNKKKKDPIVGCSGCKRVSRYSQMVTILERKKGIMTGRYWLLCPECRVDYYNREIKELPLTLDEKIRLTNWNQKNSELFK